MQIAGDERTPIRNQVGPLFYKPAEIETHLIATRERTLVRSRGIIAVTHQLSAFIFLSRLKPI